jgi:hypothetical protein
MSTQASTPNVTNTPTVPNAPNVPANPAKGNLQGQTTLAAKIDRWTGLSNNLAPQIDQMPQFKDQFTQFQGVLVQAQAVRDQLKIIKGDGDEAIKQRDALLAEGDDLFTRLSYALKAVHGPQSGRLRDYGIKPRKIGRPKKTTAVPVPPPPTVEIHASVAVPVPVAEPSAAPAAPVATVTAEGVK